LVSKAAFQTYLEKAIYEFSDRRNFNSSTDAIVIYKDIIHVFEQWFADAIRDDQVAYVWKTLVTYENPSKLQEDIGLERILGALYYSKG
jgi:hypothetical protein